MPGSASTRCSSAIASSVPTLGISAAPHNRAGSCDAYSDSQSLYARMHARWNSGSLTCQTSWFPMRGVG